MAAPSHALPVLLTPAPAPAQQRQRRRRRRQRPRRLNPNDYFTPPSPVIRPKALLPSPIPLPPSTDMLDSDTDDGDDDIPTPGCSGCYNDWTSFLPEESFQGLSLVDEEEEESEEEEEEDIWLVAAGPCLTTAATPSRIAGVPITTPNPQHQQRDLQEQPFWSSLMNTPQSYASKQGVRFADTIATATTTTAAAVAAATPDHDGSIILGGYDFTPWTADEGFNTNTQTHPDWSEYDDWLSDSSPHKVGEVLPWPPSVEQPLMTHMTDEMQGLPSPSSSFYLDYELESILMRTSWHPADQDMIWDGGSGSGGTSDVRCGWVMADDTPPTTDIAVPTGRIPLNTRKRKQNPSLPDNTDDGHDPMTAGLNKKRQRTRYTTLRHGGSGSMRSLIPVLRRKEKKREAHPITTISTTKISSRSQVKPVATTSKVSRIPQAAKHAGIVNRKRPAPVSSLGESRPVKKRKALTRFPNTSSSSSSTAHAATDTNIGGIAGTSASISDGHPKSSNPKPKEKGQYRPEYMHRRMTERISRTAPMKTTAAIARIRASARAATLTAGALESTAQKPRPQSTTVSDKKRKRAEITDEECMTPSTNPKPAHPPPAPTVHRTTTVATQYRSKYAQRAAARIATNARTRVRENLQRPEALSPASPSISSTVDAASARGDSSNSGGSSRSDTSAASSSYTVIPQSTKRTKRQQWG